MGIALPNPNKSRAVLIGFDSYRHLTPLPSIRNNLRDLRELLLDGCYWGLPAEHCATLTVTGPDDVDGATVAAIATAVKTAAERVEPDGLFLVYYAGHGYKIEREQGLRLAVYDTEDENADVSALNFEAISKRVAESRAGHRLVILDCCYAGSAKMGPGDDVSLYPQDLTIPSAAMFVSSGPTKRSVAPPEERHTAFTGELFKTLHGGIESDEPVLTLGRVFKEVRGQLDAKNRPLPELRQLNTAADVALAANIRHPDVAVGIPARRRQEIRRGTGRPAEVAFLVERSGGFDGFDPDTRQDFAAFLAEAGMSFPAAAERKAAIEALWRHWSPDVARDLGRELQRRMSADGSAEVAWQLLATATQSDGVPVGIADSILEALLSPPAVAADDRLVEALAELVSRLPNRRLQQSAYGAMVRWPALGGRFVCDSVDLDFGPVRGFFDKLAERAPDDTAPWLRPLLAAAGDARHEVQADMRELLEQLPDIWWAVLMIARRCGTVDRVVPALLPRLAAVAAGRHSDGQSARLEPALAELGLLRPATAAHVELLLLALDRPLAVTAEALAVRGEEGYADGLAAAWPCVELEPIRERLAAALVDALLAVPDEDPPFATLLRVADRTDESVRDLAVRAIAQRVAEDRPLYRKLRLDAEWRRRIEAEPGMGWVAAGRALAELCADPTASVERVADAYRAATMAECTDEQMIDAIKPWVAGVSPDQVVMLWRRLEETGKDDAAGTVAVAARRMARRLLSRQSRVRDHVEHELQWLEAKLHGDHALRRPRARWPQRIAYAVAVVAVLVAGAATYGWATSGPRIPAYNPGPAQAGAGPAPLWGPLKVAAKPVWAVAFSPADDLIAAGGEDQTVQLWSTADGKQSGTPLSGPTSAVRALAFSPDGGLLAAASDDSRVYLWDLVSRTSHGQPLAAHANSVVSLAFSSDGKRLVTGSLDGTGRIWDLRGPQPTSRILSDNMGQVYGVAFSPHDDLVATGSSDAKIRLWSAETSVLHGPPMTGHAGRVYGVAFSPDGRRLVSAGEDQNVRLWEVATQQPAGSSIHGHADVVRGVAFSPDGTIVASVSYDSVVRLWSMPAEQQIGLPLRAHIGKVYGVAFSHSGRTLATCGADGTVQLWQVTRPY